MTDQPRSTLELDDPAALQCIRWEGIVERIGWFVMAAIVIAALLGLLGPGWLSHTELETPDGTLAAEYDGIVRYAAPSEIVVRVRNGDSDAMGVTLSREFSDYCQLEAIVPEPDVMELRPEGIRYEFRAADVGEQTTVIFHYKYHTWGSQTFRVQTERGSQLSVSQFVCP